MFDRDPAERTVPEIPPPEESIRVVIDTDARNEIDDQWAIALAILSSERFTIEGFVGSNYDNDPGAGKESVEKSVREIETVLEKAGFAGQWPIKRGSHPMQYSNEPSESEGVDFIIERALSGSEEDPLWVIGLGAGTDMASAMLKEEAIVDRVVAFWHLRTEWPDRCTNFNVYNDVHAGRLLFHSPLPFVLFDTGTHLTCSMEESARFVEPYGEIGAYLHDIRRRYPAFMKPDKGIFDLGDIAALLEPDVADWETVECPTVERDLTYRFTGDLGSIVRCYDVDRDGTFELLYDKLDEYYG